jgi:GAF domain-containing protein
MIGSPREDAYNAEEVRLLSQAAKQVALALDNAVAFRQITELRDGWLKRKFTSKRNCAPNTTSAKSWVRARF